jgi:hypothetical protein
MNGIQTVLTINKIKCDKDKSDKLTTVSGFYVQECTPSEPTAYTRGYGYHWLGNTAPDTRRDGVIEQVMTASNANYLHKIIIPFNIIKPG